ncbi:hypothetical protein HanXRQr2_Chr09g0395641 [Helianthus annuus]|uniref:Uncharacterized protein n=1 Tax=Helianthus annuus TaxID=4232 RepID=A0A9K3N9L6_HELAN|nr:hypothetical protein HanXRQr2_Chr09g0395641 [Helianthus annuus]KAJ0893757.1 hypothetical protein HanPSC8_Chr09g0381411 [Helianthus annuus]
MTQPWHFFTVSLAGGFEEVNCRWTTAVGERRKYEVEFSWIPSIDDGSPMLS